jgi:hypothetical protein
MAMKRKIRTLLTTPIAALLTAVAVAACGTATAATIASTSTTGTGTGTGQTTTVAGPHSGQMKAFVDCMKSHGVTGFVGLAVASSPVTLRATPTTGSWTGTTATGTATTGTGTTGTVTGATGTTTSAATGTATAVTTGPATSTSTSTATGTATAPSTSTTGTTWTSTGQSTTTPDMRAPGRTIVISAGFTSNGGHGGFSVQFIMHGKRVDPKVVKAAMQSCSHLLPHPVAPLAAQAAITPAKAKAMRTCLRQHGLSHIPIPGAVAITARGLRHAAVTVIPTKGAQLPARVRALRLVKQAKAGKRVHTVVIRRFAPAGAHLAKALAACGAGRFGTTVAGSASAPKK